MLALELLRPGLIGLLPRRLFARQSLLLRVLRGLLLRALLLLLLLLTFELLRA